ncbi:hypothetical protein [Phenylobacterium sp.]|uniref:DUF6976 family protein n=1 Tax=Phenylobacterium sp. TaxID=1871053 RepID=UPI0035B3C0D0
MSTTSMETVAETARMIRDGRVLLLAGDEALLSALPAGRWIGGTAVNFISAEGGATERGRILVTDITEHARDVRIRTYDLATLKDIGANYPDGGFTVVIVPGLSEAHAAFAKDVQTYEGVFNAPLVGWISGVDLSEIGQRTPKCFAGDGAPLDAQAVAMHVTLPAGQIAYVDIVNLFTQGEGEAIVFDADGFSAEGECQIGCAPANLAAYIAERGLDIKLPLVADYNDAMINVSIQAVDEEAGRVDFYAPVFKGVEYRFAKPVDDYVGAFARQSREKELGRVAFSCNCILNYEYAGLEGKKTGSFVGPVTFGEIAYMLVNQTLAFLAIDKIA